ncbi:M64 family metallopeptidase [Legionella waltersii]|uniref:IgA Peptidase M64 n=1 Tax=Legionella waltersii TaxID=66969 RepID=A0A0W1A5E2_9GAMM|nr:M64 family metallopeptidase [Legionella waltersii]KTD76594.1 IgA Peptidase M64 [Legionella waltersii]SNU94505.1 IgA Peptidase M64 [Legionella waltersii]
MKTGCYFAVVLGLWTSFMCDVQADWVKKSIVHPGKDITNTNSDEKILRFIPQILREDGHPSKAFYQEKQIPGREPKTLVPKLVFDDYEVRSIVSQGPTSNRINLTIVGDGYTLAEKERFFEDANRLTQELFTGSTFASYLPLFNVHAVFVPSNESGLSDRIHKDTALGLYRDPPGSKRAIMPGNMETIDAALALAPKTDYPILIANDEFYGGLGGEYAITTRSLESGIVVLRHELGHNFGEVGEEYDGGYVYSGANSSPTNQVPWTHWVQSDIRTYESLFLSDNYVWHDLNIQPYSTQFDFPYPSEKGPYQFEILISSVGWKSPEDVSILLDGHIGQLEGHYTADRSFFTFHLNESLAPGNHQLEIIANNHDSEHVLAFAEIYAHPGDLDWTQDNVQAFATYDYAGQKAGYRPTHRSCLMRDMSIPHFCAVDLENMWIRFLSRIHLIDSLEINTQSTGTQVHLKTPQLNHLEISWYTVSDHDIEREIPELNGKTSWELPKNLKGKIRARVRFNSPEVRSPESTFQDSRDLYL